MLFAVAAAPPDFASFSPGSGYYLSTSFPPPSTTTQFPSTGLAASPGNYPLAGASGSAGPELFEADIGPFPLPAAGKNI